MEHLPTSDGQARIHIKYRRHKYCAYDQGGFVGFPYRKGIREQDLHMNKIPVNMKDGDFPAFMQAWLFFGLLSEFSLSPGMIDIAAFTQTTYTGDVVVTTQNLTMYLSEWRRDMKRRANRFHLSKLVFMIDFAKSTIDQDHFPPERDGLDDEDRLLIMVLVETLQWTLAEEQRNTNLSIPGWTPANWIGWKLPQSRFIRLGLISEGWCRSNAHFLTTILRSSVCGLYYASSLALNSPGIRIGRHQRCTDLSCLAAEMDGENYEQTHVEYGCYCWSLRPNRQDVLEIVLQSKIPLLEYTENTDGEASLEVVPYEVGTKFIAISHIWAEGLGNPRENALVACQIKRLATLVKKFSEFQGLKVYFWIDSICVPVHDRKGREMAIAKIVDIYSQAHSTIVFSEDLISYSAGTKDYLEPAMRIVTSSWMRSLWKFQEAVLSRNLYFLFADGLKDIEDLESLYPIAARESVVASHVRWFYTSLLRPRGPRRKVDADLVSSVYQAVTWRRAARLSDVAEALAPIFDMDLSEFIHCPGEQKMKLLLERLPEIPAGLVFMPGPRLEAEGFRWAPRTWMIPCALKSLDPLFTSKRSLLPKLHSLAETQSVLTERGLLVRYPGYCLHLGDPPFFHQEDHNVFAFTINSLCTDWFRVTGLDSNCFSPKTLAACEAAAGQMERLGIVCSGPKPTSEPDVALLVAITGETGGTLHSRCLERVVVYPETDSDRLSVLKISSSIGKAGQFLGEAMPPDQLWTVD